MFAVDTMSVPAHIEHSIHNGRHGMAENYLFIDVHTKHANKLVKRLNRLKNTVAADRGEYNE